MLELADRPPPTRHRQPDIGAVRAFLIESERRVILHCDKLLKQNDIFSDERRRLLRLAGEAREELQRLAA